MAPPNSETIDKISLHETDLSSTDRPNKRLKDAHVVVSADSSTTTTQYLPSENNALLSCLKLLFSEVPSSLFTTNDDPSTFRELWTSHGFRTSMVTSPHQAVSVYIDSCKLADHHENELGRAYLLSCIGIHPQQKSLENAYSTVKDVYCLHLFLGRMRAVRQQYMDNEDVQSIFIAWETELNDILKNLQEKQVDTSKLSSISEHASRILAQLVSKLTDIDHSLRSDQLLREYNHITYANCTLANACLQKWLYGGRKPKFQLDQVHFQCSPAGSYIPDRERITIRMRDENAEGTSEKLILLPSLCQVLTRGDIAKHPLDKIVEDMIESTWDGLLRNGYYVDQICREQLSEPLRKFYMSGLLAGRESNMSILLNAHFTPTYPLSLYLHGLAGAGKSSLVRNMFPALNAAITEHCDPEMMVRFVKQNLNKPFDTLKLELELRPNNNDYSVMSIIQGRRMTLSQSKPGLVMVGLEEMPSNVEGADPNQLEVSKLISMRFSGRKGDFKAGDAPRNSNKRGISGDATIINIFTSNYDLEQPCLDALQHLEMFQNLHVIRIASIGGQDRKSFAESYLFQRVNKSLASLNKKVCIKLDVPLEEGDTRPLVRYLRMLSFYIHAVVVKSNLDTVEISISFDSDTKMTTVATSDEGKMHLKSGCFGNIYAATPIVLDSRASEIVEQLHNLHPDLKSPSELCQILDFYFAKTLAPAVLLSCNKLLVNDLVQLMSHYKGMHVIPNIHPSSYKIMKSLYDSSDTPNLRDDVISIVGADEKALVAIQLNCETDNDQMQIREIIEDTPSMTAFSTERSALHKDGLFFVVYVDGSITPEIASRASLII